MPAKDYHAWISVYTPETGWIDGIIHFDGKKLGADGSHPLPRERGSCKIILETVAIIMHCFIIKNPFRRRDA